MPTVNSQLATFKSPHLWLAYEYLVVAFMALALVVYRSYNLFGALIILISIFVAIKYRDDIPAAKRETRWLYYLLIANFLLAIIYIAIGRDSLAIVKDPVRLMSMIPVMMAVSIIGLRPDRLFLGLAAGMVGASMVVGYHANVFDRTGDIYNPNPFGEIAMVSGTTLLSSIILFTGWKKVLTIIGALAAFYCVLKTETRGTLLAVLPMIVICIVVLIRYRNLGELIRNVVQRKVVLGVGALVLIAGTGIGVKYTKGVIDHFELGIDEFSTYMQDRSTYSGIGIRLELWYSSWLAFKEAPLTGIGSDNDNRRAYLSDLESKELVYLGYRRWKHNHSDYFDSLMRQGLPGMLIVIGLYWVLFVNYWRSFRNSTREQFALALAGLLTVTGYATFSITEVPLRNSLTLVYFAVLNAVLLGMLRHSKAERVTSIRSAASTDPEPR